MCLVPAPPCFELHATIFEKLENMAIRCGTDLWRRLRRTKPYSTKYKSSKLFEGFWRITSKPKRENQGKKTVRIFMWNAPSSAAWYTILLKRSEFRPAELNFAFTALLILMTSISKSMFACFQLDISPRN